MHPDQVTVERTIAAPAATIFAIVADAARHSEIDGSGTVRGTKGGSQPLELGSQFGMSMKQGLPYSTKNTVVEFEPDRRIAWKTTGMFGLVGGRIWRYELEPTDGGTIVRETWDARQDKQRKQLLKTSIPRKNQIGMERTLQRLAEVVEG
ncbi:hypothetical protein HMPREF0063_11564 [Aeromicrobium marinum DSM 15272]|uniref:Polyketide cyclase/dehydrase n=1 Tax=Aeromicrobium marinum DSM 15272 TaxID=585531 RepID=E2SC05_9ACTN|nr:SRPBCC family protein [Aeromicrobium marinum]EFQ83291.1 hypothetical protein HMPREF0063_11564 [Aeromicrobium marinum DSM 15272]